MHSLIDFSIPQIRTILWVQVIGMPIAFLLRATVLVVRAVREPAENRKKHIIRAVSNVLFAVSCWTFGISRIIAIVCFSSGIGLSVWAFVIAKKLAIQIAQPSDSVKVLSASQMSSNAKSNRAARAARVRGSSN